MEKPCESEGGDDSKWRQTHCWKEVSTVKTENKIVRNS